MKLSFLILAALVAFVSADVNLFRKTADPVFLDHQRKVLKLLVGLGADSSAHHDDEHVPFPYNKPELYKKPEALESFMKVYERGLIDKRGVVSLNCHKNRHDTFKLFDLFYYAKDFDTFFDIVSWARNELNPLQWSYAFFIAIFHREDTRGIYIPPLYEILPTYFVQSEVMHQAMSAKELGEMYGKFEVNNTGWEWSWHSDMLTGPYKSSPKWVGDDVEIRMSYFREDVGLANFLTGMNLRYASWLSSAKYPDIHFNRRGEVFYGLYRWVKNRYNLERYSNGLTPVTPFETYEPLPGYNPHLQDNYGRNFMVRSDNLVAHEVNKEGAWELDEVLSRLQDVVDSAVIWEISSEKGVQSLLSKDINGLDEFAKIIFGARDARSRTYYKAPFFNYFQTANEMVHASNDRDYTNTALGSIMTQPRDPAFYKIIASLDYWFEKFYYNIPPYTKEELSFPGVSIEKLNLERFDTYFERYDWELTNGLSFAHRPDRLAKKFEASQFRLNHKPFSYSMVVNSDNEYDATVRLYMSAKSDVDGRSYSLEQQRRGMITLDVFKYKLKSGENIIERNSHQFPYYEDVQRYRPFYEKVNKSIDTKEPFYYNEVWNCGGPQNLLIPRGSKNGKEFLLFAIVTKFDYKYPEDGYYQCHHNYVLDQHNIYFPFDRRIEFEDEFDQSNMLFSPVKVYHEDYDQHKEAHH